MKAAFLVVCIVSVLAHVPCCAVEPGSTPKEQTPQSEQIKSLDQGAPLPFPEQVVAGEVTGSNGKPIGGVAVRLFASGKLVEITHTTSAGSYELPLPLMVEKDETVVMWFTASTDDLLPQSVVLKESSGARKAGLFSECALHVKMRPQMRVDVTLMGEDEHIASLKAKDCM